MVSKLESGEYNYTVEQLWKIATKLGFKFHIEFSEILEDYSVFHGVDTETMTGEYYDLAYPAVHAQSLRRFPIYRQQGQQALAGDQDLEEKRPCGIEF